MSKLASVLAIKKEGLMRKTIAIISVCAVTACATEQHLPVSGVIGTQRAQGQSTARTSGDGTFYAETTTGLRCAGEYDSLDLSPTIRATTTCNDGRTGRLLITRNIMRGTGTAIGRLNDGTEARFVFGDIAFAEAFGDSAAKTY